jgi:hypothetical protein
LRSCVSMAVNAAAAVAACAAFMGKTTTWYQPTTGRGDRPSSGRRDNRAVGWQGTPPNGRATPNHLRVSSGASDAASAQAPVEACQSLGAEVGARCRQAPHVGAAGSIGKLHTLALVRLAREAARARRFRALAFVVHCDDLGNWSKLNAILSLHAITSPLIMASTWLVAAPPLDDILKSVQ